MSAFDFLVWGFIEFRIFEGIVGFLVGLHGFRVQGMGFQDSSQACSIYNDTKSSRAVFRVFVCP